MSLNALSDAPDTIAGLKKCDPVALAAVISQYEHRLFRYLMRLVQDAATADDLFQQTWLVLIQKIGRYDARRSFEPWLFSVAHNVAIDFLRRRDRESVDPVQDEATVAGRLISGERDALEQLLDFERNAIVSRCVGELPPLEREVLALRFEEDLTLEGIAEVTGVSCSTVKNRLRGALESLRSRLATRASGRLGP